MLKKIYGIANSKKRRLVLLCSVLLILGSVLRIGFAVAETSRLDGESKKAVAAFNKNLKDSEKFIKEGSEKICKLNENGLFYIPKPKPQPPKCNGILGGSALINGKWCKVGDSHAGAKLIKIEPTFIMIEWEGKEKQLSPLLASNGGDKKKAMVEKKKIVTKKENASDEEVVVIDMGTVVVGDDPLAWMGVELTAKQRECILKFFNLLSDDEKQGWKESWQSMSDDQKQSMIDEMQEMIDSGKFDEEYEKEKARRGK